MSCCSSSNSVSRNELERAVRAAERAACMAERASAAAEEAACKAKEAACEAEAAAAKAAESACAAQEAYERVRCLVEEYGNNDGCGCYNGNSCCR